VEILDKVMKDPILMGVAVLIAILVVFSILKKLFKFLGVVIAAAVLYVLYLTQVEGMSYQDATDETMQKGKELIEGATETIRDLQYDIPVQGQ
jgi:xanthine/uracil permease|tara:strand:- start:148 stop:426 length:279 start_codon:yes stop_codon:yes gene_type:complete